MAWIIKELEVLTKKMRDLIDITCPNDKIRDENYYPVKEMVPRKLKSICTSLNDAVKLLSKHQRTAATHTFVIQRVVVLNTMLCLCSVFQLLD